jgi:hypothetical protein
MRPMATLAWWCSGSQRRSASGGLAAADHTIMGGRRRLVTAALTSSWVDGGSEGSRVQATTEATAPSGGPNSGDLTNEEEGGTQHHSMANTPTSAWIETRRGLTGDWG